MLTLVSKDSVKISDHFDVFVCAYSMHGSGDNQPNVQKSKIQFYSVEHCTGCPFCGTSTHFFLTANSSTAFIVDPCDNFESSFAVASTFSSWVQGGSLLARCFFACNCLFNQLLPIQK